MITKHLIFEEPGIEIHQTVGLPCYNAKEIGWLAMESLCNQQEVFWDWELIVCEEVNDNMLWQEFFTNYKERLRIAGCKRIVYLSSSEWIPLPIKWKVIGQNADVSSKSFLLQAADCYSASDRLFTSYMVINQLGFDWMDFTKGYFYSFPLQKLILYDFEGERNLSMAFKTVYAKQIPTSDKKKGVDSFLIRSFKQINPNLRVKHVNRLPLSLDTDGFNNITKSRMNYYNDPKPPFKATEETIETILLPMEIKERIKQLSNNE